MNSMRLFVLIIIFTHVRSESTRNVRALQKSHEKPQAVKYMEAFFGRNLRFDQVPSLVKLVSEISSTYLNGCTPVILYDATVEESEGMLLQQLFKNYPMAYVHGQITSQYQVKVKNMLINLENTCLSYIMFMADVRRCKDVIGEQSSTKIVVIARSSQWRVYEFLESEAARNFVNLLVIAQSDKIISVGNERPYILYTHKMYIDGLGASSALVLTSWNKNNFTRPTVNLFPRKMLDGFAGHRFIISIAHQPPFTIKRGRDEHDEIIWDGVEVRLIGLLAEMYNFTTDFREAKDVNKYGSGDAVSREINLKLANLGMGGIYVTPERFAVADVSQSHSQDCASFITLASTALPRYRAIMGPFHWTVWLALTTVYLFAIFPLALSDKHTLSHLIRKPEEIENMFWYVFGTFTNCFTFKGEASWGHSEKVTTRVLVGMFYLIALGVLLIQLLILGFYWIFTIITTACYTGSIIAFVTLPVFPETVDTTHQLQKGRFQIGTLDRGGWQYWFQNSTDKSTERLFRKIEFLPTVESGLRNVTKAFFWPYAFLGSAAELDYITRTNFSTKSRRSVLHISKDCFVPYGVSLLFTQNSVYKNIMNRGLLQIMQTGFMKKLISDVEWDIMRSETGKLLQVTTGSAVKLKVEDRALSLDDTQGMFLLLGAGFLLGAFSLLSEWLGGCLNFCKKKIRRMSTASIESNPRSHQSPTPREKINSIPYSVHTRLCSIPDDDSVRTNKENQADVILHANGDATSVVSNDSTDYDAEIDKIFKLDALFGESNDDDDGDATTEEINERY